MRKPRGLTDKQLAIRRTGITGTDAAAILGVSPWSSQSRVWADKRGLSPDFEMSERMEWGLRNESAVAQWYADQTGATLSETGTVRHPEKSWMIATPDRIATLPDGRRIVLEIKCVDPWSRGPYEWGPPGTDEIPRHYAAQVAWYMAVLDLPEANIAVLFGGNEGAIYYMDRDPELERDMIAACREWWERYGQGDEEPPPDPHTLAVAAVRWPEPVTREKLPASSKAAEDAARWRELKEEEKALKAEIDTLKAGLAVEIGDAYGLEGDGWSVSYPTIKGRIDWKRAALSVMSENDAEPFRGKGYRRMNLNFPRVRD